MSVWEVLHLILLLVRRVWGITGGSCYKYNFCRDKTFVTTNIWVLSRQTYFCRGSVATKIILVAAPAHDKEAAETVPMFVSLTMILSRPFKEDRLALPLSTPLSSGLSMVWCPLALCRQVVSQASQHLRSSEKQAACEGCFVCQSLCSDSDSSNVHYISVIAWWGATVGSCTAGTTSDVTKPNTTTTTAAGFHHPEVTRCGWCDAEINCRIWFILSRQFRVVVIAQNTKEALLASQRDN